MMYTDTDSFVLLIHTDDFYKEMPLEEYDTSNYPETHRCYSDKNKKKIGLPKDEGGGKPIAEFVTLRSKCYCVRFEDSQMKKCKGVKKCVVEDMRFDDYKRCLDTGEPAPDKRMNIIGSRLHELKTLSLVKKTLSAFDDKRYYTDGVTSLAHGHWRIAAAAA